MVSLAFGIGNKISLIIIFASMLLSKSFSFKNMNVQRLRRLSSSTLALDKESSSYPNFSFSVTKLSKNSNARLGTIVTPHGEVSTPNFIFCGTKATMKALSPAQLREANAQIMLSNTYHLMLTPGPDIVEKMGGLQKFSGWNGPMFTDSGGYQIFSMGFGSVSNEIKGKRLSPSGENINGNQQTLLKINEHGATFRSFIDGTIHELTPEKSIQIQRKLGADLIVVLDECTPYNVNKNYTEESMHRSHRWGDRSLAEFLQSDPKYEGKQALYGIVQGGVYKDLRDASCAYVNSRNFFGTAIGGSLGDNRECMHDIVRYTRQRVREDRPVHLLGIGGVRDILHGVRCGIDTFDCVHPSRMGRHGGALVLAEHWDREWAADEAEEEEQREQEEEEQQQRGGEGGVTQGEKVAVLNKWKRMLNGAEPAQLAFFQRQGILHQRLIVQFMESLPPPEVKVLKSGGTKPGKSYASITERLRQHLNEVCAASGVDTEAPVPIREKRKKRVPSSLELAEGGAAVVAKENIHLTNGRYRSDPRPIDPTCGCYTCKSGFSRAYLHHLFKVGESLGGTLVTLHNVFFMNRLMADIREGIKNDNLDDVDKKYVHPTLV